MHWGHFSSSGPAIVTSSSAVRSYDPLNSTVSLTNAKFLAYSLRVHVTCDEANLEYAPSRCGARLILSTFHSRFILKKAWAGGVAVREDPLRLGICFGTAGEDSTAIIDPSTLSVSIRGY